MTRRKEAILALTPEKLEAIRLSVDEGLSSNEIGKALGRNGRTIRRWLNEPEAIEEYREMIRSYVLPEVARAHRNLMKDLKRGDEDKEPYVRQNATFFALNKYGADVMGDSESDCTVTFVGGSVPEIGMPPPSDDE